VEGCDEGGRIIFDALHLVRKSNKMTTSWILNLQSPVKPNLTDYETFSRLEPIRDTLNESSRPQH
jgi:hypothetical protein